MHAPCACRGHKRDELLFFSFLDLSRASGIVVNVLQSGQWQLKTGSDTARVTVPFAWASMRPPVPLLSNDVHVWAVKLSHPLAKVRYFRSLLSADERVRARRFYFDQDRCAYTVARSVLRLLIGHYQGCRPAAVEFYQGKHGKPAMLGGGLEFNISHSHGIGLLAFARGRDIGVDVEKINPRTVSDPLAKRSFSAWEYEQFTALPRNQRSQAFYRCWTRKEAFIKALGMGLAFPLNSFDVSLHPDQDARLIRIEGSDEKASKWTMEALAPCRDYLGAVVAGGHGWHLSCFAFPDDGVSWTSYELHQN